MTRNNSADPDILARISISSYKRPPNGESVLQPDNDLSLAVLNIRGAMGMPASITLAVEKG
ncbi:hypothetical protein CPT76_14295 [Paenibacillus sp. AR247]|nr:hypothetical protein CPT76_14295 [Paenibacillus sp. AR247]